MTGDRLRRAVADLRNESALVRTEAAAMIRDLAIDLGGLVPAMAGLLVLSALFETEDQPYEQMLFTLGELSVLGPIPVSVLEPQRQIEPTQRWEVEYLQDIFDNATAVPPSEDPTILLPQAG